MNQLTKVFLTLCIISIFLGQASAFNIPFFGDGKVEKTFNPSTKAISLLNDKSEAGIEITTISVTQDIDRFEEIFKISAIGENYNPAELTDFLLRYEDKNKKDISSKITSETWYYQDEGVWTELNKKNLNIKKDESIIFKLVLTKRVVLGEDPILIVPTFMDTEVEEMTWWNSSWIYKKRLLINNTGNDTGLDYYQISVDLTSNPINSTSLRVVNETADSAVPHWCENVTGGNCTLLWFNATHLDASVWMNDTYYVYYDNDDVSSTSDIDTTFEFAEDFEDLSDGNWNGQGGWVLVDGSDADIQIISTDAKFGSKSGELITVTADDDIIEHTTPQLLSGRMLVWLNVTGITGRTVVRIGEGSSAANAKIEVSVGITGASNVNYMDSDGTRTDTGTDYTINQWNKIEIIWRGDDDKQTIYWNDTKIVDNVAMKTIATGINYTGMWGLHAYDTTKYDGVCVGKYTSPEPTAQLGIKELAPVLVTGITEYNTQRKLARTSEGYLHRVYVSSNRVYYGRSIDNGDNWVETVLTTSGVNNTHPSVAVDLDDNIWVFYEREDSGIRYRVWRGTSWQSEVILTTDSGEVPVVAVDGDDNIHVGYMVDHSTYQINYTYYDGTSWSEASEISTDLEDQKYPSIAIDSNDYVHVAYQGYNQTSRSYNIKYRKYTTSWQSIYNVTSGEDWNQTFPSIAIDLSDYIHVAWQTGDSKIKYRKYTTSWQSVEEVCDGASYFQYNPSVSVYATNYVYVTWFGKTATYNETYIIREKHYSGSWSAITDILHPAGKNVTHPGSVSALHPVFCGNCYSNIPLTGFSIVYDEDDGTINYYNSSTWRCPDKYVLTVIARDISTNQVISNFTALLSTGETGTTDDGAVKFTCLDTGYYDITVSSSLYHSAQQSIVLDMNKEVIIYLVSITEEDYYAKITHEVEFRVRDWWGNPIADVNVTAGVSNITMPWSWVQTLLGYGDEVDIQNTTLSGFTDSSGRITFMMVPTVEYTIIFNKPSQDVYETLKIYPKETQYTIIVSPTWSYTMGNYTNWSFSAVTNHTDSDYVDLCFVYNDTVLNETSSLWFYVKHGNGTQVYSKHYIYNKTIAVNHTVYDEPWAEYIWGFNATHITFGSLRQDKLITFRDGIRVDLNLDNEDYYTWFSIAILVLLSTLFSVTVARFGYIIIPFFSLFFWYINWLSISITLLLTVLMLGVLLFMGRTEREKGL